MTAAKSSEHLYEEQAAAIKFTTMFGDQLIAMAEAGRGMRESLDIARYATLHGDRTYLQADIKNNKLTVMSIDAWDAATKGEES